MSRIVTVQSNFTSGEVDPKINARIDLQQYYNGLQTAKNVTILPQGGVTRRDGSEFVAEVTTNNYETYSLLPFSNDIQVSSVTGTEFIGQEGIWFKPDGTEMYALNSGSSGGNHYIEQFSLSSPWDLSTITHTVQSPNSTGQGGLSISHDGQYVFVCGNAGGFGNISLTTLSTAWDLSTAGASVTRQLSYNGSTSGFRSYSINFNADGTKAFFLISVDATGSTTNVDSNDEMRLVEYTLASAYNFTGETQGSEINVGVRGDDRYYFNFASDGSKIYIGQRVYVLTTPYNLSTASASAESTAFDNPVDDGYAFYVRNDESHYYYVKDASASVNNLVAVPNVFVPKFKMVHFEFSVDDSYMLVLTQERMYVFKNGALVTGINGTSNDYLEISALRNTYVDTLNFTQAADSLILAHPDMHPQFIQRGAGDSNWTVTDLTFAYIPKFAYTLNIDDPQYTITPSDVTGNITFTASSVTTETNNLAQGGTSTTITFQNSTNYTSDNQCAGLHIELVSGTGSGQSRHITAFNSTTKIATVFPAFITTPDNTTRYTVEAFKPDSVDEYIVAKNGFGRARITEVVSATLVKAVTEIPFFDTNAITSGNWELEYGYEDTWSDARGWPRSCVFHEGRLFLGGSKSRPSTLWSSRVADFFNFDPGEQLDDSALLAHTHRRAASRNCDRLTPTSLG